MEREPSKKEVVKALNALAEDYSNLIAERRKADKLYFSGSVPQPTAFKKPDKSSFYESDCEKLIAGKYTVNGKKIGSAESDCIDLKYDEPQKQIDIYRPTMKKPSKPMEPIRASLDIEYPVLSALSAVLIVLAIVMVVVGVVTGIIELYIVAGMFIIVSILIMVKSKGGIFALIIQLFHLPTIFKQHKRDLQEYNHMLEIYPQMVEEAQVRYDKAMQKYERQVAEAEKEYERQCKELLDSVLKAIEEYIVACKEYFKKKKQTEEENERQKAIFKKNYDIIVKKIVSYPDFIPSKFFKVPDFENASTYKLGEIKSELKAYVDILESGRADTLKEATNCYIADKQAKEQNRILEAQAEEQRELLLKQACSTGSCPNCGVNCHGMSRYCSDGCGGCKNYYSY